jgi:hypothetical protein
MRHYKIDLPLSVPSMFVPTYIQKMKDMNLWDELPESLQEKATTATQNWCGLDLTQEDLDSIPDEAWGDIATQLNIEWD